MQNTLLKLVIEYFELERKSRIPNPENLIYVESCMLEDNVYRVYFKNKTIKHFVERRKEDLLKRNSKEKTLQIIINMIKDLPEAITAYTKVTKNYMREDSYLLYKDFQNANKTPVTLVLEQDQKGLLIISYYFTKR